MGKWTPNYVDDVLHSKISSLVTGAIRRASVDKEPSISYENFVNELDIGDSFTASVIDILVKELADRRTRPNVDDRRLISDRTVKSLRVLANSTRGYSHRLANVRSHARRAVNLNDYFAASHPDLDLGDEDDDFGSMDIAATIEGARVNSDLYDAFNSNPWSAAVARRPSPAPVSDEWALPSQRSPSSSTRPWSASTSTTTSIPANLSRTASIRRATRSRLVDFNEFTHRRRSANREQPSRSDAPESVTEPRENLSSQTVRRFFPFPRPRRQPQVTSSTHDVTGSLSPDSDDNGEEYTNVVWYDFTGEHGASPGVDNPEEAESLLRAPRLRRGGVRPPESIFSRHASPVVINAIPTPASAPPAVTRWEENASAPVASEEPAAYPTPGSTENEHLS
ncbi:hypothetical protein CPC08DRAFT_814249 [Agrocybe pediades]|nr:hypothetical protein CPC08DRAFT_814249 [Agrocybe pediades]